MSPTGITCARYGTGSAQPANHDHRLNMPDVNQGIGRTSVRPQDADQADHAVKPLKTTGTRPMDVIMQMDQGGLRNENGHVVQEIQEHGPIMKTLPIIRVHETWIKHHFDEWPRHQCSITVKHLPCIDEGKTCPVDMYHVVHEILTLQGHLPHGHHGVIAWKPRHANCQFTGLVWIMLSSARLADEFIKYWNGKRLQRGDSSTHMHPKSIWQASGNIRAELSTGPDRSWRAFDFASSGGFTAVHTGSITWSGFQPYDINRHYSRPSGMAMKKCDVQVSSPRIMAKLQESIKEEIEAQGYDAEFFMIT